MDEFDKRYAKYEEARDRLKLKDSRIMWGMGAFVLITFFAYAEFAYDKAGVLPLLGIWVLGAIVASAFQAPVREEMTKLDDDWKAYREPYIGRED